ncbi:MAG: hypothetical protein EHM34_06880 [Nitrosopumilales archaeon]|nr:MAG: hypothetical protein EHM34_06880 [Nitrosopumilales archaeon]
MKIQNLFIIPLLVLSLTLGGYSLYGLTQLFHPVTKNSTVDSGYSIIRQSLIYLRCPRQKILRVSEGIEIATAKTGIGGVLLASLLFTESNFRSEVVSNKGYRGIAQPPTASMKYLEVDILHGAMILKDKLHIANGNITEALMLYKGGRNPEAKKQAREVMIVYNNLIRRLA